MTEKRDVVDNLELRYEGIFSLEELYKLIDDWQIQMGYDRQEMKNFEQVFEAGRDIEIELQPWKKINENEKIIIKIIILVKKMKDIKVKMGDSEVKMNQGQVQVRFAGFLFTDYFHKWEGKPYFFFLKSLWHRFVYYLPTDRHESLVAEEVNKLYSNVKGHLNLMRRRVG
ncbi:hypothetical protein JXB31_04130 [Candidatus Woesearchaeota archaeon]|nr:hypothetical protein [Candidatus Woesearchaeota archaeon]